MTTAHLPENVEMPPPRVEEVSDGIYGYIQLDGSWGLNNTGFIVGRDGVLVIDTCFTERRSRAFHEAVRKAAGERGVLGFSTGLSPDVLQRLVAVVEAPGVELFDAFAEGVTDRGVQVGGRRAAGHGYRVTGLPVGVKGLIADARRIMSASLPGVASEAEVGGVPPGDLREL